MKQTKEITEAKKWWRQINGTHKQLALGKKYFSGLDSGLSDDQIEFIYSREVIAMQPQETASSNDSLETKFFSLYKPPLQPVKSASMFTNRTGFLDRDGLKIFMVEHYLAEDKAKMELDALICDAVNNYNALKDILKGILEQYNEPDVQMKTPIAFFKYFDKAEELLKNLNK